MPATSFPRDRNDPWDTPVQVNMRVPFWYHRKIQETAPGKTVQEIMLDIVGRHIAATKPKNLK
jgi:hypothetical protein